MKRGYWKSLKNKTLLMGVLWFDEKIEMALVEHGRREGEWWKRWWGLCRISALMWISVVSYRRQLTVRAFKFFYRCFSEGAFKFFYRCFSAMFNMYITIFKYHLHVYYLESVSIKFPINTCEVNTGKKLIC